MTSQTQYFLNLEPTASARRIALLGDQTLAELHDLVSDSPGSANNNVRFRVANRDQPTQTRLDELNLSVGQTFDYLVDSDVCQILVEAIDY
jgi:FtsP/CotA-like multicopper oxidase with cupredoxin domain